MYVTIKECHINVMSHDKAVQHEDNVASDNENEDLFFTSEDRFDDNSNDGLDEWHANSLDNDWLYDSDISNCNNVEGETEHIGGVDVGNVQCDDPIYNYPIAGDNDIRSPKTLLDDSYQKKKNFEIRVKRSCKGCFEVACKDKACKFGVPAMKLPEEEYWQVQTFHKIHMCIVDGLQGRFRTTSVKIIGELMSHKLQAKRVALRPKDIIGRFKGVMFVAVCKDANECAYPVAFGIGHVEDEDSWTWYLSKLHYVVSCPKNTMFISNQHLDIKKAIQNAFSEAHHSLCSYHLKKNFKNKFKHDDVSMIFTHAEDCYKVFDFNKHMD
ncbi:Transposase [Theobroma cacao]|nr:Transposase [Theobroma cacao]